jgi:hypothetical protein
MIVSNCIQYSENTIKVLKKMVNIRNVDHLIRISILTNLPGFKRTINYWAASSNKTFTTYLSGAGLGD